MSRPARGLAAGLLAAWLMGACAGEPAAPPSRIPASLGPERTVTPAVAVTRADLVRALGGHNLVLDDTQRPFRPPESPAMTVAPRAVYQVLLPDDPDQGFVVVYEFPDPTAAAEAAAGEAAYLASGPGRVQGGGAGTVHVIRVVGSTVVLYSWHPDGSTDAKAPGIQAALETLGTGVPIPG